MDLRLRLRLTYVLVGVIAGGLFLVHVLARVTPWALVWPAIGGIVIAMLSVREGLDLPSIAKQAGRAAAICGAVILGFGVPSAAALFGTVGPPGTITTPWSLVLQMFVLGVASGIVLMVATLVLTPLARAWARPQRLGPPEPA